MTEKADRERPGWDYKPFASWVRAELRRREWNDSDLARRMGVSSGMISHWLSGERRPNPYSCDLLADALHADLDTVLALVCHRPTAASAALPKEIAPVVAMLRRINPTPDRITGLTGVLRSWLEIGREQEHVPE
jgi:transcriptional regulator with XRE-family HTH domain